MLRVDGRCPHKISTGNNTALQGKVAMDLADLGVMEPAQTVDVRDDADPRASRRPRAVGRLTSKEQRAVRTALRFLRLRVGAWGPLAKALRYEWDSIQKVATGKRAVTPALALRVARFAGIPMDELLAGQWLSARVCPHCGHPPEDFVDEETMVE
jgi:hypothetical protein